MLSLLAKIIKTGHKTETPPSLEDVAFVEAGKNLKDTINKLYGGRSLRIRHVDAGSNNGEEYEMTALGNAYYDVERFGLSFVASPRHADILTVSGPVTRNMEHALKVAYEMTPEPRIVIAVGDGACTGGIWKGSYAVAGSVADVIPVDWQIPGDPPAPVDIIRGLLKAIEQARA
ncbi:hydrogenase [Candidatus Kaiserbacteria bacterium]|nr:hydrogenase [Candidatus Kaiserbacteria bacterium]